MYRNYNKPTLRKVPGKASWYVFVTKPEALRKSATDKQVRRTTGTTDKRQAEKLVHSVAEKIYSEFDKLLERDPFVEILEKHWKPEKAQGLQPKEFIQRWTDGRVLACQLICLSSDGWDMGLANKLFTYLDYHEALDFRSRITPQSDPYPIGIQNEKNAKLRAFAEELEGAQLKQNTNSVIGDPSEDEQEYINKSGAPQLSDFLTDYETNRIRWKGIRKKEVHAQLNRLKRSIKIIGDLPIDQVLPNHGLRLAEWLDEAGKSHATVYSYVQSLRAFLNWIKNTQLNSNTVPPTPWLIYNPLVDLDVTKYGVKKRKYEAFTTDQLHKLFSLEMASSDRLLLSILITTGMRLDEAALLTWEQYKEDRNGLRYFDLSIGAIVKNDRFSARTVALPDCLNLPVKGHGRIFDFKIDNDGKSSSEASKHLSKYTHAVRYGIKDDRKVVHSLRHNLSGLMLNLRPTPSSEIMNWITGHGMEGNITESERQITYGQDPDVSVKYEIINRIDHPWLE